MSRLQIHDYIRAVDIVAIKLIYQFQIKVVQQSLGTKSVVPGIVYIGRTRALIFFITRS